MSHLHRLLVDLDTIELLGCLLSRCWVAEGDLGNAATTACLSICEEHLSNLSDGLAEVILNHPNVSLRLLKVVVTVVRKSRNVECRNHGDMKRGLHLLAKHER